MAALLALALVSSAFDQQHAAWTSLLRRYLHAGEVDYGRLKQNEGELDWYLRQLASVKPEEFEAFSREDRLAFRINAYNAYTVRMILDHYPVSSIRKIGLLPGSAFRSSFIPLLGATVSLSDVEDSLRAMGDPRIHFAIVCASRSCPELRGEAYRGADLDPQLEDAARRFLEDGRKNRHQGSTLQVSSIFKWYRDDFVRAGGSLERYLARYGLRGAQIEFLDYDWSLNGR
jgi:hypothetical protein